MGRARRLRAQTKTLTARLGTFGKRGDTIVGQARRAAPRVAGGDREITMMHRHWLGELLADELGATAIEYGLIVALIAVAMITALQLTGNALSDTFSTAATAMGGG